MTLTLPLPFAIERKMPPEHAKLHFAIGAFAGEEITLGQAAEIAGISQTKMMQELSRRRIPLHYDQEEFAQDLQTITTLGEKLRHAGHQ